MEKEGEKRERKSKRKTGGGAWQARRGREGGRDPEQGERPGGGAARYPAGCESGHGGRACRAVPRRGKGTVGAGLGWSAWKASASAALLLLLPVPSLALCPARSWPRPAPDCCSRVALPPRCSDCAPLLPGPQIRVLFSVASSSSSSSWCGPPYLLHGAAWRSAGSFSVRCWWPNRIVSLLGDFVVRRRELGCRSFGGLVHVT